VQDHPVHVPSHKERNPVIRQRGCGGFGGRGGFDRGRNPRTIDEPALKQIAQTTGGSYHRAENANQLQSALNALPGSFTIIRQRVDAAVAFAVGGAILITAALSLSLWWNRLWTPTRGR
jgi:Ca-activated chloride channel family protein